MLVFTRFSRCAEGSERVRHTTVLAAILRRVNLVNGAWWKAKRTILVLEKRDWG